MTTRRTRFFYLPMLFSYISVLAMCSILRWRLINQPPRLHVMEVNWYKEGAYPHLQLPQRQYLDITFTGDTTTDKTKLDFGHLYLKDLMKSKDTIHGLYFHFGNLSPYWVFVAALDLCRIEYAPTYALCDEGLFIFNLSRSEIEAINRVEAEERKNQLPVVNCGSRDAIDL